MGYYVSIAKVPKENLKQAYHMISAMDWNCQINYLDANHVEFFLLYG